MRYDGLIDCGTLKYSNSNALVNDTFCHVTCHIVPHSRVATWQNKATACVCDCSKGPVYLLNGTQCKEPRKVLFCRRLNILAFHDFSQVMTWWQCFYDSTPQTSSYTQFWVLGEIKHGTLAGTAASCYWCWDYKIQITCCSIKGLQLAHTHLMLEKRHSVLWDSGSYGSVWQRHLLSQTSCTEL